MQTLLSLCYWHTESMDVDEDTNQNLDTTHSNPAYAPVYYNLDVIMLKCDFRDIFVSYDKKNLTFMLQLFSIKLIAKSVKMLGKPCILLPPAKRGRHIGIMTPAHRLRRHTFGFSIDNS